MVPALPPLTSYTRNSSGGSCIALPSETGRNTWLKGRSMARLGHAGGYFSLRAETWEITAHEMRDVVVTRVQHSGPPRRSRSLEERLMVRFPGAWRALAALA
jgi:hypothetical protein